MSVCRSFDYFDQTFFHSHKESLIFVHQNIRSLRKNFDSFLAHFYYLNVDIDIVVLSEIWIFDDEKYNYKIPNYNSFFCCNDNYRSGGIAIFIKDTLDVKVIDCKMQSSDILLLELYFSKCIFSLLGIYRLQESLEVTFINELKSILNKLKTNTVIVGDINIDIKKQTRESELFLSLMYDNGFHPCIDQYTRIVNESASCIDHIFVRHKNLNIFQSGVFHVGITDHSLIALIIQNVKKGSYKNNTIMPVVKNRINFEKLKNDLSLVDWSCLYQCDDVDMALDVFYLILNEKINVSLDNKVISIKLQKAKFRSPWITQVLLSKIDRKNKLSKLVKRRPYDVDLHNYFNRFKNNLNILISEKKKSYYNSLFNKNNGNPSEQWKIINSLIDNVEKRQITKVMLDSGSEITDPLEIANSFNDYFVSAPLSCVNGLPAYQPAIIAHCIHQQKSMYLSPVTPFEISTIIKNLRNTKSTGYDNISAQLIKYVEPTISNALAFITNLSFTNGKFPTKLKKAIVVPVFKKGDRNLLQNNRPIALLSIISKIIEKCMKTRLISFLNSIKFFSHSQFGFTEGKSTETAICTFMENIFNSINCNEKASGLFIDFTKAFDLVDHDILLQKLSITGVRGLALKWFESYLRGRTQQVRIQHSISNSKPVSIGVPQGSVISASLFLIFINDLLLLKFKGNIIAFADDVALRYSERNWETIWNALNNDLKILRKWCNNNKMIVNTNKTKFINFDLKKYRFEEVLKFHVDENCRRDNNCNCLKIEQVDNIKYLGVNIDETLSWTFHISQLQTQLRRNVRTFYFLRNYVSNDLLRTLYFALIHSRLSYGLEVYGGATNRILHPLEIIQKHFIRILSYKGKREPSLPLFKQLGILPLKYLFVYKVLKIFYVRSGNIGVTRMHYQTRMSSQSFFIRPRVNKTIFSRCFVFLGPKIFNVLPKYIKECSNLRRFQNNLKSWILLRNQIDDLMQILQ